VLSCNYNHHQSFTAQYQQLNNITPASQADVSTAEAQLQDLQKQVTLLREENDRLAAQKSSALQAQEELQHLLHYQQSHLDRLIAANSDNPFGGPDEDDEESPRANGIEVLLSVLNTLEGRRHDLQRQLAV
jgi:TolA-binding protein